MSSFYKIENADARADPLEYLSSALDSSRYGPPVMVRRTPVYDGAGAIHKLQGDSLRLDCLVDGSPQPTIVWFKVGSMVYGMPGKEVSMFKVGSMVCCVVCVT